MCRQFTGVWNIPTRCSGPLPAPLSHGSDKRRSGNGNSPSWTPDMSDTVSLAFECDKMTRAGILREGVFLLCLLNQNSVH